MVRITKCTNLSTKLWLCCGSNKPRNKQQAFSSRPAVDCRLERQKRPTFQSPKHIIVSTAPGLVHNGMSTAPGSVPKGIRTYPGCVGIHRALKTTRASREPLQRPQPTKQATTGACLLRQGIRRVHPTHTPYRWAWETHRGRSASGRPNQRSKFKALTRFNL